MKTKIIAIVSGAAAIIAAAIAAIVVFNQKAAIATAEAEKAASQEEIAAKEAKKAEAERSTSAQRLRDDEVRLKTQVTAREVAAAEIEKAKLQKENLAAELKIKDAVRDAALADSKKAADERAAKQLVLKAENAKAEAARAQQAASEAEAAKAQALQAVREAETLKLKVSMAELVEQQERYQQLMLELQQYKLELDERERALHPDKTIANLSWVSTNDTVFGADGKPMVKEKKVYRAEDDLTLPFESRHLAKISRENAEVVAAAAADLRSNTVSRLEALYTAALKADRPVDAEYYRVTLKHLYPDWKYTDPEQKEEQKK